MISPRFLGAFCAVLLAASTATVAFGSDSAARAAARHRLQQQQLQDDMTLRLQQDMARNRPGLTLRDRQILEDLALRKRIEQQQLDQQQLIESRRFAQDPVRARVNEDLYAQERDLQPAQRPGELSLP